MQSAGELDIKTEIRTSASFIGVDIKNEIDTNEQIDSFRIKCENEDYNDSPVIPDRFIKTEQDELETYVDEACYIDTVQLNEELKIKNEICADQESSYPDLMRIKTEHNTEEWNECPATQLHTEFDVKRESNPNTFAVPTTSVTKNEKPTKDQQVVADTETAGDTFVCYSCKYATSSKPHLIGHMKMHENRKNRYSCNYCDFRSNFRRLFTTHMQTHTSNYTQFEYGYIKEENVDDDVTNLSKVHKCKHCNSSFRSSLGLVEHTIRIHPDFISSITRKIHECTECDFKTANRTTWKKHVLKHFEAAGNNMLYNTCIHCNTAFKSKDSLNEHIIKKHPKFIKTITRKIHACSKCSFKTTVIRNFQRHLLKHPETAADYEFSTCVHCNTKFKNKYSLHEHITKSHPKLIASITCKIHECTKCSFKTTISRNFQRHLLEHPETAGAYELKTCLHCNATFKFEYLLNEHIIQKHPHFITSVTWKIHSCSKCTFKTTISRTFQRHLLKHPETASDYNFSICPHCDKEFVRKISLDDHIVKNHQSFISSVTARIHHCPQCTYKTVKTNCLKKHMVQHAEMAVNNTLNRCTYCDKTYSHKRSLNQHIIKIHPEFIATVSSKMHECTKCDFKTTVIRDFKRHVLKHPVSTCNLRTCMYCDVELISKRALNNHIIETHLNLVSSVKDLLEPKD